MERMSPEKGAFQKEISSSNQHISVDVLVFGGVTLSRLWFETFFIFTPNLVEMIQVDLRIFFNWVGTTN